MKLVVFASAALLPIWALPGTAWADTAQTLRETVVNVEAPVAIPLSEPLRDRFGVGTMPALSATLPVGGWTMLGLRLRGGFLSNGPAPADRAVSDPGMGGLIALSAIGRFRPLAKRQRDSRRVGPWIELGVGPGLTGTLLRAVGEAAVGCGISDGENGSSGPRLAICTWSRYPTRWIALTPRWPCSASKL